MILPDEFKFTAESCDLEYAAELIDGQYVVTWLEVSDDRVKSMRYFPLTVAKFIAEGSWVILPGQVSRIIKAAESLQLLVSAKKDASLLAYSEVKALNLTCGLITRLLNGRS